jgi:hypothetical protein
MKGYQLALLGIYDRRNRLSHPRYKLQPQAISLRHLEPPERRLQAKLPAPPNLPTSAGFRSVQVSFFLSKTQKPNINVRFFDPFC